MKNTNKTYAKLMLGAALAFSFAAEATNYTSTENRPATTVQAGAGVLQDDTAKTLHKTLLGPYADIDTLTVGNIHEAYITFIGNVREQHGNWSDKDWQEAKAVLDKLDHMKNKVENQLNIGDKMKIKAMQAEFKTLETADEARG